MEGDGHVLDFVVEIRAHVTLDPGRGHEGEHAAKEKQERFEDAEHENGGAGGPHGCGGAPLDEVGVDEALEHLRNHEAENCAADRAQKPKDEPCANGFHNAPQANHGVRARGSGTVLHDVHNLRDDGGFVCAVSRSERSSTPR